MAAHRLAPLSPTRVERMRLPRAGLTHPGYDRREVDAFLEVAAGYLARERRVPSGDVVRRARFTTCRRLGYRQAPVDDLLDRIARILDDRGSHDAV